MKPCVCIGNASEVTADERTAAVAAKRKASSEQRYLHVRNKLI
jgi:hypothetical protein